MTTAVQTYFTGNQDAMQAADVLHLPYRYQRLISQSNLSIPVPNAVNTTSAPPTRQPDSQPNWRRRAVCKGCSKRRKVEHGTLLCSECAANRLAALRANTRNNRITKVEHHAVKAPAKATESPLYKLDSPASQQRQMLSTFINDHWTPSHDQSTVHYIQALASQSTASPILAAALDTMLYAYFGSVHGNDNFRRISQDHYARTISLLVPVMDPSRLTSPLYSPRDVIASILLIRLYDNGRPQEKSREETHFKHLFGALRYLRACGPNSLDGSQLLDRTLLEELYLQALLACIAYRKECPWSLHDWSRKGHFPGRYNRSQKTWNGRWFSKLAGIPGLLDVADGIQRERLSSARQRDLASICRQLSHMRNELLESNREDLLVSSTLVDVHNLGAFNLDVEEQCFMSSTSAIPQFYKFSRIEAAFRCGLSWLHCLVADCTILRILYQDPELESMTGLNIADVEQQAYQSAVDICKCMLHYSKIDVISVMNYSRVILHCAQSLFEEQGRVRELGWCQALTIASDLRLARLRRASRPDLCRIADLTEPMAEAAKYRPRDFLVTNDRALGNRPS